MNSPLLFQELTREEARARASRTLMVFPVGSTEQHGPHLPVGTDTFVVEYVARAAATEARTEIPVLVAPTLPFGCSQHHLPFGGTMSLSTDTYYRVVSGVVESLILSGFRRIFILNGHGGNQELIQLVARDLALKYRSCLAAASYWVLAWDALIEQKAHMTGRLPGHAGAFETSQMMSLRPDLVRGPYPHREESNTSSSHSFSSPYRVESHGYWQNIEGYTDSPDRADAGRGKDYLAAVVSSVAKSLVEFYKTTESRIRELGD
jgi:creatinine amidohydrolase